MPNIQDPQHDLASDPLVAEILEGLQGTPKTISTKFLYDDVGGEMFRQVIQRPEYYLTRSDLLLLQEQASSVVDRLRREIGGTMSLIEFGPSDETKALLLLEPGRDLFSSYVPLDIDVRSLKAMSTRLRASRPGLSVEPLAVDFCNAFELPATLLEQPVVGLFTGNTVGQLAPDELTRFFARVARSFSAAPYAIFLLTFDTTVDPGRLLSAYDGTDPRILSFGRNSLHNLNRLADADFDADAFYTMSRWNEEESRVELYLQCRRPLTVRVAGRTITFVDQEMVVSGTSYRYAPSVLQSLAAGSGWRAGPTYTGSDGCFALQTLTLSEPARSGPDQTGRGGSDQRRS